MTISHSTLLRIKKKSDEVLEKIKAHIFMFNIFFV